MIGLPRGAPRSRLAPTVRRVVLVAAVLTWLGPFSMDAYSPGFPAIGAEFGAAQGTVALTLTATLLGLVAGQVVGGLVSDRYGRRRPLLVGLGVFVVASLGCACAPDVGWLVAARFVQGASAALGVATSRTLGRDVLEPARLGSFYSQLTAVQSIAPVVGPLVGSVLMEALGSWRWIFVMITGLGVVALLLVAFGLPETHPERVGVPVPRRATDAPRVGMLGLLGRRDVRISVVLMSFATATVLTYLASTSFLLQDRFGLSARAYGVVFAVNAVGLLLAGQLNARLVRRVRPGVLATWGFAALAFCGTATLVAFGVGAPLVVLLVTLFGLISSYGFCLPNVVTIGMSVPRESAGAASALLGVAQYLLGAVGAPVIGLGAAWDVPLSAVLLCAYPVAGLTVVVLSGRAHYRSAGAYHPTAAPAAPDLEVLT